MTKPAPGSRITCADDHRVIGQRDKVIPDGLRRTTSRYDYLSTLTYLQTSLSGVTKPAPGSRITCADDHWVFRQRDEVIRDHLRRTTSRYDYLSTLTYLHTSLSGVTRAASGSRITHTDDHWVIRQRDERSRTTDDGPATPPHIPGHARQNGTPPRMPHRAERETAAHAGPGGTEEHRACRAEQNGRTARLPHQAEWRTTAHTGPLQTERNTYAAPGRMENHHAHWAVPDRMEHRRAYRAASDRTEDLHVCRTGRNRRPPRMLPWEERKNAAHVAPRRMEDRRACRAGQNRRPPHILKVAPDRTEDRHA